MPCVYLVFPFADSPPHESFCLGFVYIPPISKFSPHMFRLQRFRLKDFRYGPACIKACIICLISVSIPRTPDHLSSLVAFESLEIVSFTLSLTLPIDPRLLAFCSDDSLVLTYLQSRRSTDFVVPSWQCFVSRSSWQLVSLFHPVSSPLPRPAPWTSRHGNTADTHPFNLLLFNSSLIYVVFRFQFFSASPWLTSSCLTLCLTIVLWLECY